MQKKTTITQKCKEDAEIQIREKQKSFNYRTTEYPLEVLIQKYMETNELFIPENKIQMSWDEEKQSKFIETVFLGLPINPICLRELNEDTLEITDGIQRFLTIKRFINNEFTLCNLQILSKLNNFSFKDVIPSRQRRFKRFTVRVLEFFK